MTNSFEEFRQEYLPHVEKEMLRFIEEHTNEKSLLEGMAYSIRAGGKRLRPLLMMATLNFFNQPIKRGHYQAAAALELIHTYSLIHDDLPAMDSDDLRRGKPTNHKVYGEALAILAGDGLLTAAFYLLSESELAAVEKVDLIQLLGKTSGSEGMVAGQVADIAGEKQLLTLAELQQIHARKTGALIEFAVLGGTILAKQSKEVYQEMAVFAQHFGIAFQIKDDLLDVLGDEKILGKRTGMDQQLNKSTYPSLLGVEGARQALTKHVEIAWAALNKVSCFVTDSEPKYLKELLAQMNLVY